MKCLVTGGAGFIGSNLVKLLYDRGFEITVLDNCSTGYKSNLNSFPKIRFVQGDIRDLSAVNEVMSQQDVVFHFAASVGNKKSIEDPFYDSECNVFGVLNLLESMRKHQVKSIIFSSSAGIFGEPQYTPVDEDHPCWPDSPYGTSKLYGERVILSYMKLYSIRAVCLRYFNVYGVHQRFDAYGNVIPIFVYHALKKLPITIFGDGLQTRDFINVADVAQANLAAALNPEVRGVINIGSGSGITINELAALIKNIVEEDTPIHYGPVRPGDVKHCTANVSKMQQMLGIRTKKSIKEGLIEYIHWMKSDPVFLSR